MSEAGGMSTAGVDIDAMAKKALPVKRVQQNKLQPDWEYVYLELVKTTRYQQTIKALWKTYISTHGDLPDGVTLLSYSAFRRGLNAFKTNLPPSLRLVQAVIDWEPGECFQVDYSGDPWHLDTVEGKKEAVQIFVGVSPYSNYCFFYATLHQTRDDWLDALVSMYEYFNCVSRYLYLDNSTSLVTKADKYKPTICKEFNEICRHYGTIAWPLPPHTPRGKASVEGMVGILQQDVYPKLVGLKFFTMEDLNAELRRQADIINAQELSEHLNQTRLERFRQEAALMKPLPAQPYEKSMIKKTLVVRQDCQVRIDNHRYSVPYGYIKNRVDVVILPRARRIRIYDRNTGQEIASHTLRDSNDTRINNIKIEHLPEHLQKQQEDWRRAQARLGREVGPSCAQVALQIAVSTDDKTAVRLLHGIEHQAHVLTASTVEGFCMQVIEERLPTYERVLELCEAFKQVKKIKDDKKTAAELETTTSTNVRGAANYTKVEELTIEESIDEE